MDDGRIGCSLVGGNSAPGNRLPLESPRALAPASGLIPPAPRPLGGQASLGLSPAPPSFPLYKGGPNPFVPTLSAMQKTRKSIAKRFKVTGTGKVMRRSPNTRHLLSAKSRKQRRRANKAKRVDSGLEKKMKISMPFA